uniref:Mitochondrial protein Pet127 n=1 Tax=Kwoniella dejecticola CBS 10117 TaxID=1296121 RepID=A0A1A6AGR8_9TREE|nr:uncharacterized protein I303_01028 [Kwoniella dejecticola CBS 10117]OBR89203.1 hypothetical protein I303_01028 [Kwoniella dejecticola CBS 10117]
MAFESRSFMSISHRIGRSSQPHLGFIASTASSSTGFVHESRRHARLYSTASTQHGDHSQEAPTIAALQRSRRIQRQTVLRSLGSQADDDLVLDTAMARSLEAYQQRHRSGAPTLQIPSTTKDDLPRRRMAATWKRRPTLTDHGIGSSPLHDSGVETSGDDHQPPLENKDIEEALGNGSTLPLHDHSDASLSGETGRISAVDVRIQGKSAQNVLMIEAHHSSPYSPGVSPLRDSRTGVWNFEPSLHSIPQPESFAFHRCPPYITPSQDQELVELAQRNNCGFVGSTSTLTKALSQIYFAISGGKGVDLSTLSQDFSSERTTFTPGAELPASIIIDKLPQGIYSVDSDKRWDVENVISDFGRILEKMLTCENADFKRFLSSSPESAVPEEERNAKEAYRYQRVGSLLMRSQLDCYDPRLPGNGVFDIKTRACLPIRHDRANYQANAAYDIWRDRGYSQSYEREYYDLLRAGMLKFSLQVRIGGMDGIFLAYHNTARLFGFQYISLSEIDERIFGSTEMADQAFKLSVSILEQLLHRCVDLFPNQAVNVVLKHSPAVHAHSVTAYVEPKEWDVAKGDRPVRAVTFTMENYLDGEATQGPVSFSVDEETRRTQAWAIKYTVSYDSTDEEGQKKTRAGLNRLQQNLLAMNSLAVPAGQTVRSMTQRDRIAERKATVDEREQQNSTEQPSSPIPEPSPRIKWREAGPRQVQLREEAKESGRAYEKRKKTWKRNVFAWTA